VVGVFDVARHVDTVAGIAEAAQHHVAQHGIVFDQEDSHRHMSWRVVRVITDRRRQPRVSPLHR